MFGSIESSSSTTSLLLATSLPEEPAVFRQRRPDTHEAPKQSPACSTFVKISSRAKCNCKATMTTNSTSSSTSQCHGPLRTNSHNHILHSRKRKSDDNSMHLVTLLKKMKWTVLTACLFTLLPVICGESVGITGWERPVGMPNIAQLEVMCGAQHMEVHLAFDSPFHGMVAAKGMYGHEGCVYVPPRTGNTNFVFNIYYDKCGTKPDNHGKFYENTVVVQYDEELIEAWDEAKRLRCEWFNDYEKTATKTSPMVISDLEIVELNFHGDNVDCWMEIQEGKGPWAAPLNGIVPLGSPLTMVVAVKDPTGEFDMRVKACEASDGQGGHMLPLSDPEGCILRPKLLGRFSKVKLDDGRATVLTYAYISAFKFPDMLNVHLRCTVEICRYGCPDHCSSKYGQIPHAGSNNLPKIHGQNNFVEPMAYESKINEKIVSPNDISENPNRPTEENAPPPLDLAGFKHTIQQNQAGSQEIFDRLQQKPPIPGIPLGPNPNPPLHQQQQQFQRLPANQQQPNRPGIPGRPGPGPFEPQQQEQRPHSPPGNRPGPQLLPPGPLHRPAPHHYPPMPHHLVPPNTLNMRHPHQQGPPRRRFPHNQQHHHPGGHLPPQQQPPIFVQAGNPNIPHHPGLGQSLVPPPPPQGVKEELVNPRHNNRNNEGDVNRSGEESRNLRNQANLSAEMLPPGNPQALKADRVGEAVEDAAEPQADEPAEPGNVFPKGPRNLRVRRAAVGTSDVIGVQGAFRVVSQADLNFALNATTENSPPTIVLKGRMTNPGDAIYGICLPRAGFGVVFFGIGLATLVSILIAAFLAYAHYKSVLYNKSMSSGPGLEHHIQIPQQVFPMVILRKMW